MRVVIDPRGLGRILNERDARTELAKVAVNIVQEAKALGPRNPRHTTHEIDRIGIGESRITEDGAEIDVDWLSSVWHLLEFGSVNNLPYRPLTRAAQNQGLRVIDRGRQ